MFNPIELPYTKYSVDFKGALLISGTGRVSRLEMPEEDYLEDNTCKLIVRALSGANDRVAVTEITSLPNFEELRRCQLSESNGRKIQF